jgi:hypothetical protein
VGYEDAGEGVGGKGAEVETFVLAGIALVLDVTMVLVMRIEALVIVMLVLNSSPDYHSSHAYYLGEHCPIPNLA